jgi:hypothetical protein
MPEPPSPATLESFGNRPFSFYPAIRNVEYNEWTFRRETWSEVQVANSRSAEEIWIPRHFIGTVSSADEPVLIVGLKRELELKGGAVWPYREPVVAMPGLPREAAPREPRGPQNAPPPPEPPPSAERQVGRLIAYALVLGVVATLLGVVVAFRGLPRPWEWWERRQVATTDQKYLSLTREDGSHDVARKLGAAARDQWITPEAAEIHFRLLWYPDRSYVVVLMGPDRNGARYIGTLHASSRRVLDAVKLPGGGSTSSMLRALPQF